MKKILAIAMALVMICSLSVAVFADDVLYSEDTMFWSSGNWTEYDLEGADFFELLNNENAYLVVTRDTATTVSWADGGYEKFNILDSWWSGVYPNPTDEECGWIQLGTAGHTSADEASILVDCVSDDGVTVMWPAKPIYDLIAGADALGKGGAHMISNCSAEGAYKIINVSIIVPDAPIEAPAAEEPAAEEPAVEPVEEAPAVEAAPVETAPAATTTTAPAPAKTGVVMAVLPMAVAAAAVAFSKKR